jgi:lipoprotein-releasing system ATP-binding protein
MKVSILNNLNLEIKSGESISIIGASGSGKSTLLHVLSSLDRADSGDIILDNLLLSEINENELCKIRLRKIGFIYQFHHLINELTVKENIALPLMIDKKNKSEISNSVNKVIEQVDLKKRENFQIEKLSGGERQRVAIARSIVHDPKIIFADEPTGNLDKNNARNIFALLNDLANYNKSSLLMATHDLDIASKLNKSLILENGTLMEGNI